jgi:hypothetical protein
MSGQLHTSAVLPPGKGIPVSTGQESECKTQNIVLESILWFCVFIEYADTVAKEKVP